MGEGREGRRVFSGRAFRTGEGGSGKRGEACCHPQNEVLPSEGWSGACWVTPLFSASADLAEEA